jgi:carbon storage regulator CsrA
MLVLSRRLNERIVFPSISATVQIVAIKPGVVRLGIDAPPEVTVLREEVRQRMAEWGPVTTQEPAKRDLARVNDLLSKRLSIAVSGLNVLNQQLEAGSVQEARATLRELADELELLQERMTDEFHAPVAPRPDKSCRALLVEDNANERELLASFLRMSGLEVDTAGDGRDALDYLDARDRPDVVLLDMGLPRCDGQTAVKAIRRNPALAGLKIFAVSGHLPTEYDLVIGPNGVDRWFHKPVDPQVLVQNLELELEGSLRGA